ncbi:conserved hypothetical protein [Meyerozyma guilliermondii ATCC 6260]|uniref:Uncharacterized protein n=1 Tax=Meyerozyma guilliermondii (strain ATCC 6260 / CBS 566 / DSM 6381 / JCM 1539 / NBRC 10279 / NRRL Y-324) TaxID=294746 RepID=A5DDT5_PICGU|nr:uncharacterized protein PGUG_01436 [Meyerozyma guilliermondii ATCC 6260]EDK37338.2 conserved hypothetical protein [Meyerozyma guilliermondii ATCC 6260]
MRREESRRSRSSGYFTTHCSRSFHYLTFYFCTFYLCTSYFFTSHFSTSFFTSSFFTLTLLHSLFISYILFILFTSLFMLSRRLALKVNPLVVQRLLLQFFPALHFRQSSCQTQLFMGLYNNFLDQTTANFALDFLGNLLQLHNLESVLRQSFDRLFVDRIFGILGLQNLQSVVI